MQTQSVDRGKSATASPDETVKSPFADGQLIIASVNIKNCVKRATALLDYTSNSEQGRPFDIICVQDPPNQLPWRPNPRPYRLWYEFLRPVNESDGPQSYRPAADASSEKKELPAYKLSLIEHRVAFYVHESIDSFGLRDMIYHYYVFEADGYHFDYNSCKLRAPENRPINLALMYTCTTVATELQHLALKSIVVHFPTIDSEAERLHAGRFDRFLRNTGDYKDELLMFLDLSVDPPCMDSDSLAKISLKYPEFAPLLHPNPQWEEPYERQRQRRFTVHYASASSSWGQADSLFREFRDYLIELLSKDPDFSDNRIYSNRRLSPSCASFARSEHLFFSPDPWSIPTEHERARISTLEENPHRDNSFWKRVRWRFSATSAAIYFFKFISHTAGLGLRKVVLHEDRLSVAHPESHALGLIPFCSRWQELRVERRVNVWRVLMLAPNFGILEDLYRGYARGTCGDEDDYDIRNFFNNVCTTRFSQECAKWITEAYALGSRGMPANSFSLTLDGDSAVDHSSQLFELVKQQAAWQVVRARLETLAPGHWRTLPNIIPGSDVFPQAVTDIIKGTSLIRCKFSTGDMYDAQQVLNDNKHIPLDHWYCDYRVACRRHPISKVQPAPP
ncbi:hypothetical protein ACLMJK_000044 [Lecanora helva]